MMNKVIKITCSFLLLLSLFSISAFQVYADDEDTTEGTSEVIENASDTDFDVPEEISVQALEEENDTAVMSNEVTSTDRVSYVDVNGETIENAPETIKTGKIEEHKDLNIEGRHFDFISAKVGDLNCVYIGIYDSTVYYSTDGIIAIKMEDDQKLIMTYQEYYNISFKEDIPENGTSGIITHNKVTVDVSQTVRVNAGNEWEFEVTPAVTNTVRYKISSVTALNDTFINQLSGDEYDSIYSITPQKDDEITISYSSEGLYRVHIKETNNDGEVCITTDKDHYEGTYINDFTFKESELQGIDKNEITLPIFHTIRGKRIITFQLDGETLRVDNEDREVPWNTGSSNSVTVRYSPDQDTTFDIQIILADHHTLDIGDEKNCSYEYQLKITKEKGDWQDFNFIPTYYDTGHQALSLRLLSSTVEGKLQRSDAGMNVVVWDPDTQTLVEAHDNDTYNMDTTYLHSRKQVKFFFAKAKPGYRIDVSASGVSRPSGKTDLSDDFGSASTIDKLTENYIGNNKSTNFENNWEPAKMAAIAQGYTAFIVISGESGYYNEGVGEWELYAAQFVARTNNYYVLYDKGNLPEGSVVSDMPSDADMTTSSRQVNGNNYTNAPVYGPRSLGTTFNVGENSDGPMCDGYMFTGWKLVDKNGNEGDIYQNGSLFTISSDNVSYSNNDFCIDNSAGALNSYSNCSYRFVAQWKKIGSRTVQVNHYLKVPDGTEKLEKTEGTISFVTDNETVTAIASPEPAGTFPGYIFDKSDERNILEKSVTNDGTTETIELNLYYKPTVLTVSKTVTGYNLEPDKEFTFTISSISSIEAKQIYIKKAGATELLTFTDNKATFTLKRDESVEINCLPTEMAYTVTETDPGANFKASYKIGNDNKTDGNEAKFTMPVTGITDIEFTNTSTISPPATGIVDNHSATFPLTFIPVCIAVILAGFYCIRKFR